MLSTNFHVVLDNDHGAILDDLLEQFRGLDTLRHAHAGNGFVEHQQLGVLNQQHPDLEPLLLSMTEGLRRPIEMVAQKDHGGDVLHPLADLLGALPEQGAGDVAAARYREFEIFEHREVFVDRRSLEFSSDTETYDLLFLAAGDFLVLELDRALRDLRPTADQVEHRGLAGAVRPDDDAQLALVDVEVESVDGLEPIEGDADVLEREQKSVLLAMIGASERHSPGAGLGSRRPHPLQPPSRGIS
jgi:hypothetical protein